MNKRFQECNLIVKIFRMRWYLLVPFQWMWYTVTNKFKVIDHDEPSNYYIASGKNLWRLMIGLAQVKMNWVYTSEEVFKKLDTIKKKKS